MSYIKWVLGLGLILSVILFAHYSLPGRDIVQIVGTDVTRKDDKPSGQSGTIPTTRDVRFINTLRPNGDVSVYRNEDTGWGWPPYFKFDSSNITAQAQAFAKKEGVWVAITHYGWRIELFSVFPNAVKIRVVDGPEATLIPWFNIVFFIVLAIVAIMIFRMVRAFKRRNIDPMIEDIDTMIDDASDDITAARKNLLDWIKGLFK